MDSKLQVPLAIANALLMRCAKMNLSSMAHGCAITRVTIGREDESRYIQVQVEEGCLREIKRDADHPV